MFQSSFELTGYITKRKDILMMNDNIVSKLFRAYRLYNSLMFKSSTVIHLGFKALSSLQVI